MQMELNEIPQANNDDHRKRNSDYVSDEVSDKAFQCGLGSWRPAWLQWLANHYAYSFAFIMIGIIQGMSWTYFNGIVTTFEKAFHVDSRTMGFVLAGNDVSQIMCGFIFTFIASRGNRPFWMATGILIGAMACFMYASTQLFWDQATDAEDFLFHQHSNETFSASSATSALCSVPNVTTVTHGECVGSSGRSNMAAAVWLFFGQFISGIGGTTTYSLGFAYMDDNIKKRNSPLYIGLTSAMRALGPTLGYLLASFCLSIYIIPGAQPAHESGDDPRWLGAWWLGFMIIGILQTVFAFPILLFPREILPKKQLKSSLRLVPKEEQRTTSLKDFIPTLKRLFHNPIIVGNVVSFCTIVLAVQGSYTFMPKYLEARFGQTASQANIRTGLTGQMMISVGVFTGGVIIWKFKPRAVYVAAWTTVMDFLFAMGFLAMMNLDCNDITLEGISFKDGRAAVTSACSAACDCAMTFDPVCVEWQNFMSPCMAGCTTASTTMIVNVTKNVFHDCACGPSTVSSAYSGFCKEADGATCSNLWIYTGIFGAAQMLVTSTRVGCLMIIIRSVIKEDKGVALTLIVVIGSIFGYIPSPIIYGTAVDSACLLWEETPCGHRGNCWLYDVQTFSNWFHGLTIFFILATVVADIFVAAYSRHLRLYDEDPAENDGSKCESVHIKESMLVTRSDSL